MTFAGLLKEHLTSVPDKLGAPVKIKFFSSFCADDNVPDIYYRLCQIYLDKDYGTKYEFVKGNDVYTHAIILNTAMPKLNIPKQNVLGLSFEPIEYLGLTKEFILYAQTYIGKYYIGLKGNLPEPFIQHFSFMWHNPRKPIPKKTKKMSFIFSKKQQAPGHIYRYNMVKEILKTDWPIDIYGYGCELLEGISDSRIKGKFKDTEPFDDYEFHVCIENYQYPLYISEKYMDPVLQGCIPIYLGASGVDDLFPNSTILLSGNMNSDLNLIKNILYGFITCDLKPVYPDHLKLNDHIKELWL